MKTPSLCFVTPYAHALFTGHPRGFGGAEVQQGLIGRALAERGFDVRFVSYAEGPPRQEVHSGVRFWTIPPRSQSPPGRLRMLAQLDLWRALGRANADVYYQRCAGSITGLVGAFARLHRRPFIFSVANDRDLDGRFVREATPAQAAMYRAGLGWASAIVVQTRHQERLLRERLGRESVLIPSACALPPEPLPLASQRQGVLWVGNLQPRKRPQLVAQLAAALPDVSFTMIAPGVGAPGYLKEVLEAVNRQTNVRRLDRVPYPEMPSYYRKAALLLSTSAAEGFPNVFMEAWANRCPVVSLEIDPDEIICEKGLGIHSRTTEETVGAVGQLVSDETRREAMGQQGQAYVRAFHAPEVVAEHYQRLLRDLTRVSAKGAAGAPGRTP